MKFDKPATANPIDRGTTVGKPTPRIDGPFKTTGNWVVSTWGFRKRRADGQEFVVRGCDVFVFRGGLIVRKDAFRKTYA